MKKILSIASILALGIMLQASAVSAHVPIPLALNPVPCSSGPAGYGTHAWMAILSEWDIVPEDYYVPFESHFEYYLGLGHENDESNLSFQGGWLGWSQGTNRLYFMMERFDNLLGPHMASVRRSPAGDDSWEIMIDSDHGGDQHLVRGRRFRRAKRSTSATRAATHKTPITWPVLPAANRSLLAGSGGSNSKSTWHDVPPWGDYGFQLDGEVERRRSYCPHRDHVGRLG